MVLVPDAIYQYLAALGLVFLINLVPAFMPASWMVLVFFRIKYGLPLLALSIGGAVASALGRLVLARASGLFAQHFLKGKQSDLHELGTFLNEHRQHVGLATLLYTLSPLPTNNLFIAAGMVGVELSWVFTGFLAGRLIANTFWVWLTAKAFHSLNQVFAEQFKSWPGITLETGSIISVLLLFRLPWARWLRRRLQRPADNA
jgi:hypothetical protein